MKEKPSQLRRRKKPCGECERINKASLGWQALARDRLYMIDALSRQLEHADKVIMDAVDEVKTLNTARLLYMREMKAADDALAAYVLSFNAFKERFETIKRTPDMDDVKFIRVADVEGLLQ